MASKKGHDDTIAARRYTFRLYPTPEQEEALRHQAMLLAKLWNALLERHNTIRARTKQRQAWGGEKNNAHVGWSTHSAEYHTIRGPRGETITVEADNKGEPKFFSNYAMQAEVTWLRAECPEFKALSSTATNRIPELLEASFKMFFTNVKNGQPAAPPGFKRSADARLIPFKFASGSSLKKATAPDGSVWKDGLNWVFSLQGIPGQIFAKGKFPVEPVALTVGEINYKAGRWLLSVSANMPAVDRPTSRETAFNIKFDLIDGMARVNGRLVIPEGIPQIQAMEDAVDRMKSDRDKLWPEGWKMVSKLRRLKKSLMKLRENDPGSEDISDLEEEVKYLDARCAMFIDAEDDIKRHYAKIGRKRSEVLHVWTTNLVKRASEIVITMPAVRPNTRSAKGNEDWWGAHVNTVAKLNRNTLSQAPATVAAMLEYKAKEAGIRFTRLEDKAPNIAIGHDLATVGKANRSIARKIKRHGLQSPDSRVETQLVPV